MSKHKKTKQLANKKQKGKKGKQKNKNNKNAKTPSLEELLQAGDSALLAMEGDKAMAFFASALSVLDQQQQEKDEPTDNHNNSDKLVYVLEKLGELKASEGNSIEAKQDFERAIGVMTNTTKQQQQQPQDTAQYQETLAGLHLYIGQLSCEQEALEAYKKGLECLEHSLKVREQHAATNVSNTAGEAVAAASMEVDTTEEQEEQISPQAALKEVRQKLASARVTVAELYLTDLCYDENAEQQCEHYVQLALEIQDPDDDTNEPCMVDALQTAASLKLSQQQTQSARTYILRAYQKIKVGCEALSQLGGIASSNNKQQKKAVELLEVDAAEGLPSFDFRCQTAKLLLECASQGDNDDDNATTERAQCNAAAIQVLGSLLAENDEVPDIYYLLGCAYHGEGNADLAQHYWSKAMQMLESIQQEMEQQQAEAAEEGDMQVEDEEENDEMELQIQAISCQIEEIKSKLEDLEESSGGGGGGKPKAAPKADDHNDDDDMEE